MWAVDQAEYARFRGSPEKLAVSLRASQRCGQRPCRSEAVRLTKLPDGAAFAHYQLADPEIPRQCGVLTGVLSRGGRFFHVEAINYDPDGETREDIFRIIETVSPLAGAAASERGASGRIVLGPRKGVIAGKGARSRCPGAVGNISTLLASRPAPAAAPAPPSAHPAREPVPVAPSTHTAESVPSPSVLSTGSRTSGQPAVFASTRTAPSPELAPKPAMTRQAFPESATPAPKAVPKRPAPPPPAPKKRAAPKPAVRPKRAEPRESFPAGPAVPAREERVRPAPRLEEEGEEAKLAYDAIPALIEALEKGSPRLRARAADELAHRGPEAAAAADALIEALSDTERRVRASAALALGAIGAPARKAEKPLRRLLRDKDEDVRDSAKIALQRLER